MRPIVPAADLTDESGQFLRIGDATVYVVDMGAKDRPAIVLLHGLLLSGATFKPLVAPLVEAGYRVVAFDRPPFGLSDKSPALAYGVPAEADLTLGVMDALNLRRAALLGHSAGGRTAAQVAWKHPERVSGLVLVAPSLGAAQGARYNRAVASILTLVVQGLNPFPGWAEKELRRHFTDGQLQTFARLNFVTPPRDPAFLADAVKVTRLSGWEAGFRAYGRSMTRQVGAVTLPDLRALKVPTLILWGEQDQFIHVVNAETVRAAIPGSTLRRFAQEGHMPWFTDPAGFAGDIAAFLKQN